ncbi:unnamed protein product [Closterium sp. NIES-64]|nr:unnamed protein product [Closterium sp. NIES-64]
MASLTEPSVAKNCQESVDVVDLLPGPIWHIIFRLLLLPPLNSAQLQNQENSSEEVISQGAESSLSALVDLLTARVQHGENNKLYGSAWPLLCAAVASKRLLHHVLSFSVSACCGAAPFLLFPCLHSRRAAAHHARLLPLRSPVAEYTRLVPQTDSAHCP